MPTFYNYALNDMEESQINDAKRRVTGYNNNQTERLSLKPVEDPTNGLIDIQLSRLTDDIYLAGKEIDNLDSYLRIDTSLIVMTAGIPAAIKKTIQDSVKIYISITQSVEKIRRTYRNLSKNIKFASLHVWTDFTGAVGILFKQNLVLNDIVDKFVNDYRAAIGQPPVDIRRPDRIEEDQGDGGDDDDDDGDGGDEAQPPPPPAEEDAAPAPEEDDPTDPESEASFDARTQYDEDELQDTLDVDTALPSSSGITLSSPKPFVPQSPNIPSSLVDRFNLDQGEVRQFVQRFNSREEDKALEETERSGATTDRPSSSRSSYTPFSPRQPNLTQSQIRQRINSLTVKENNLFQRFIEMFDEDGKTLLEGNSQKMANLLDKQIMAVTDEIGRLKSLLKSEELPLSLPPPPVSNVTRFPLRIDLPRPTTGPLTRGIEQEDVNYEEVWPDLIDSMPQTDVWPTIAGMAEETLTMEDIEDMPFWPDIADQEGFTQRFLTNKQDRSLGKMVKAASKSYADAWKTLAGSRTPTSIANILGRQKNRARQRGIVKI